MEDNLQAIYQLIGEINHQQEALKEFNADLDDRKGKLTAFRELQDAQEEIYRIERELEKRMREDGNILAAIENVSKIESDLGELEDTLSLHLLRHYRDNDSEHIPLKTDTSKTQEIVIKAKLGRVINTEKR